MNLKTYIAGASEPGAMLKMFHDLDTSGNGEIEEEDFISACRNMRIQDMEKRLQSYAKDLKTVIRIIDYGSAPKEWNDIEIDVTGKKPSEIQHLVESQTAEVCKGWIVHRRWIDVTGIDASVMHWISLRYRVPTDVVKDSGRHQPARFHEFKREIDEGAEEILNAHAEEVKAKVEGRDDAHSPSANKGGSMKGSFGQFGVAVKLRSALRGWNPSNQYRLKRVDSTLR